MPAAVSPAFARIRPARSGASGSGSISSTRPSFSPSASAYRFAFSPASLIAVTRSASMRCSASLTVNWTPPNRFAPLSISARATGPTLSISRSRTSTVLRAV